MSLSRKSTGHAVAVAACCCAAAAAARSRAGRLLAFSRSHSTSPGWHTRHSLQDRRQLPRIWSLPFMKSCRGPGAVEGIAGVQGRRPGSHTHHGLRCAQATNQPTNQPTADRTPRAPGSCRTPRQRPTAGTPRCCRGRGRAGWQARRRRRPARWLLAGRAPRAPSWWRCTCLGGWASWKAGCRAKRAPAAWLGGGARADWECGSSRGLVTPNEPGWHRARRCRGRTGGGQPAASLRVAPPPAGAHLVPRITGQPAWKLNASLRLPAVVAQMGG